MGSPPTGYLNALTLSIGGGTLGVSGSTGMPSATSTDAVAKLVLTGANAAAVFNNSNQNGATNFSDVAIFYNGTQIDCHIDQTEAAWSTSRVAVRFKLQASIGANAYDGGYVLAYGKAASPGITTMQNLDHIYPFWDLFAGSSLAAKWTSTGSPSVTVNNGLTLAAPAGGAYAGIIGNVSRGNGTKMEVRGALAATGDGGSVISMQSNAAALGAGEDPSSALINYPSAGTSFYVRQADNLGDVPTANIVAADAATHTFIVARTPGGNETGWVDSATAGVTTAPYTGANYPTLKGFRSTGTATITAGSVLVYPWNGQDPSAAVLVPGLVVTPANAAVQLNGTRTFTISTNDGTNPTVTLAITGGGTLSTSSITLSGGTGTVTFTAGSMAGGPYTLSATASGYTTGNAAVTVAGLGLPTGSYRVLSPYNWVPVQGGVQTANPGAYIREGIRIGTANYQPVLQFDTTAESGAGLAAANYPKIRYVIDDGEPVDVQLQAAPNNNVTLPALAIGNHEVDVWVLAADTTDRWGSLGNAPTSSVLYKGIQVDGSGGTATLTHPARSKNLLVYGDSISEGDVDLTSGSNTGGGEDATAAWAQLFAVANDYEVGVVGFPSQGYTVAGQGGVPPLYTAGNATQTSFNQYWNAQARSFVPAPDGVIVAHGTNDRNATNTVVGTTVAAFLSALRSAVGVATKIGVLIPYGGWQRGSTSQAGGGDGITGGYTVYQAATPDANAKLLDLGTAAQAGLAGSSTGAYSFDGLHPKALRHAGLAALIGKAWTAAFPSSGGGGGGNGAGGTTIIWRQ